MIESISHYYERCEPNWHFPQSKTPNHIVLLVTSGAMYYTVEQTALLVKKGDMLLVPEGVTRSIRTPAEEAHEMYVAHFRYDGSDEGLPILDRPTASLMKTSHYDYIRQRFSQATQHWLKQTRYSKKICNSILTEIIALMNEEIDTQTVHGKAYAHVVKLQQYMLEHYRENISVLDLANLIDRTPNYVSAIFKQATGQTISDYLQRIRISAACDLLINSRMSIKEISDFLGFCEQSYFTRVFKRVTGTIPTNYVKEEMKIWRR